MSSKNMRRILHNFFFFLFFKSLVFFSQSVNSEEIFRDEISFRVLSWSVNDNAAVVVFEGDLHTLKIDSYLPGSQFKLKAIHSESLVFSGERATGEVIRIFPKSSASGYRVVRTTLLPEVL